MTSIGSLRHKVEVRGHILSTGMKWEADAEKPGGEAFPAPSPQTVMAGRGVVGPPRQLSFISPSRRAGSRDAARPPAQLAVPVDASPLARVTIGAL